MFKIANTRVGTSLAGSLIACSALLGGAPAARAQFAYSPAGTAALNAATTFNPGFRYSPSGWGGWGYGNNVFTQTPMNGYLTGVADLTTATGQYWIQTQQASLMREQTRQASLDTRRKMEEQRKWELANTPTAMDQLDYERQGRLREARSEPPLTVLLGAGPHNALLKSIQGMQGKGLYGPRVSLEPETLKQVSLTSGVTRAGPGLLKDGGKLQWPLALDDEPFDDGRKEIDGLMVKAVSQASKDGKVDRDTRRGLNKAIESLDNSVASKAKVMSSNDFIQARRYMREVRDAAKLFDDPNVGNYFGGKWDARGDNVAELVAFMTKEGLTFAPATRGAEAAYRSLHSSLVAYDSALSALASAK